MTLCAASVCPPWPALSMLAVMLQARFGMMELMMELNYYQTLIAGADDWPVATAVVPRPRRAKKNVAVPLPKKHGWGLLFDRGGWVALCPMESDECHGLANGNGQETVLKALHPSRTS